jgi:hypothetical protein
MSERQDGWAPRKLTHEQARAEQRLYWCGKSVPERLAAMTALNERMLRMRGIDVDKLKGDLTVRFIRRARGY